MTRVEMLLEFVGAVSGGATKDELRACMELYPLAKAMDAAADAAVETAAVAVPIPVPERVELLNE